MSNSRVDKKKGKKTKKKTREEKLADALKRNIKLRKVKNKFD
jgi:hypothetical protein